MAEVVGLVSASHQFINQSTKLITLIKALQSRVQDIPSDLQSWRCKLEQLQTLIQKIEADPAFHDAETETTSSRCTVLISTLDSLFSDFDLEEGDGVDRMTWKSIGGSFKQPNIRDLFTEIDEVKSLLTAHIGVVTVNQGIEIPSRLQTLDTALVPGTEEEYCLQALFCTSALDDRKGIITTKGHRTPGTCTWVPTTKEYQAWDRSSSGILWITGPTASGKTFIAIYLSQLLEVSKPDATLLMFFCDCKFSTRRTAVCVLRGLMHQLVLQHAHLISCVTGSWKVQNESLFGENSFDVLWRIFVEMLDRLHGRDIYLVLDGLDECEGASLVDLLSKLTALVSSGEPNGTRYRLKCILLSRDNPPCLPKFLSEFPRLRVDQIDHGDLNIFISEKVSQLATTKNIKDTPLHHQIEASFASTCHGSFLWVILMAADLSTKSTADEISERLHHLPLQSLHTELLLRNKDKKDDLFITLTLLWLDVATRPLSVPEICDAVETIDVMPAREERSREEVGLNHIRSLGHILQMSPAFSIIDESGSFAKEERVTFFHQATKDPNIEHQGPSSSDHRCATRSLLEYMSEVPRDTWLYWDDSADESPQAEYPLLNYAIHNWYKHARHLSEGDFQSLMKRNIPYYHARCLRTAESQSLVKWARRRYFANPLFFAKNSTVLDHWLQASNWGSSFERGDCPMLHVACMLGLENLVRILLRKGNSIFRFWRRARVDVSAGTGKETPLHFAVREKHEGVVSLLLEHGADPCLEDIDGLTPIHYTLERSWAIFDILSRHEKANKFMSNPHSIHSLLGPPHLHASSLLHFAARAGQEDICRALIERFHYSPSQLDQNTQSSVLEMVIEGGHLKLARALVEEWHAKIHSPTRLLSAVSKARLGENELIQILKLLTSTSNIDLSTPDEVGNTLLHRALDPDISIRAFSLIALHPSLSSTRNTFGRTILDAHEVLEPIFILTLLFALQHNLDLNNQDKQGQTILHHLVTCLSGYISDVFPDYVRYGRVLLDLGVCRDVKDREGRTPADLAWEILKQPTRAPFQLGERGLEILEKYEMARLLQEDSPKSVFDNLEACDDETWKAIRWYVKRQQPLRVFLELLDSYNTVPINPSTMPTVSPDYFSQDHGLYGPWAQALQWGQTWPFDSIWKSPNVF